MPEVKAGVRPEMKPIVIDLSDSSSALKRSRNTTKSELPQKRHKYEIPDSEDTKLSAEDDFFQDDINDSLDGEDTRVNPPSDTSNKSTNVLKSITNVSPTELSSSPIKSVNYPKELDDDEFDEYFWNDSFKSPDPEAKESDHSVHAIPSSNPRHSTTENRSDLYQSISIYQSNVIELQKTQIALLQKIVHDSSTQPNSTVADKLSNLELEISRYESCIQPLKLHANNDMPLPTPTLVDEHLIASGASRISKTPPVSDPPTPQPSIPSSVSNISTAGKFHEPPSNPGSSANAPLRIDNDQDFDDDDGFGDFGDFGDTDLEELTNELQPPPQFNREPSPGFQIISSELGPQEIISDIEIEDITSSPQGVKMTQVAARNRVIDDTYPWSDDVNRILHETFKLSEFRCNQLEAVNAALMGKDVFVLMPTGGGKSLCYQLPALVTSGKTRGVTVVVSPLISLMQDQTFNLKRKGIKAAMLSSKLEQDERSSVFRDLFTGELSLLYVSPEMLSSSNQLRNALSSISGRNQLARLVIDEAHCVSSWGHDFRPDYKLLENLKVDYPDTPIMALTATANDRVRLDIFKCLRENNTTFLKQSFNRANLYYEVQSKAKDVNEVIANLMHTKFKGKSGIIYCHSRASCETTSQVLQDAGLKVTFYHAMLSHKERESVQLAWQSGKIQAICATIAFGMGIDKPDVRFVFHLTLPRNMEGYYQETGRAGRDGLPSECTLFYNFRDAMNIMSMINKDDLPYDVKQNHLDMLKRVIQYCQNTTDCRRKQVLQYFSETFDVRKCRGGCDICKFGHNHVKEIRDITARAKEIVEMVAAIQKDSVTLSHCVDVYRGSRIKKIMDKGHDRAKHYAAGKNLDKTEVERMFHHLITESVLEEYSKYQGRFSSSYIKRGAKSSAILSGKTKITMVFNPINASAKNGTPSRPTSASKKATPVQTSGRTTSAKTPSRVTPARTSHQAVQSMVTPTTSRNAAKSIPFPQVKLASNSTTSSPLVFRSMDPNDFQENCYGKLELKRLQLKNDFNLPKVSDVCSNITLEAMARILPTDLETFSKLSGISQIQVDNFYMFFRPELVKLKSQQSNVTPSASAVVSSSISLIDDAEIDEVFQDDEEFEDMVEDSLGAESPYFIRSTSSASFPARRTPTRSSATFTSRVRAAGTTGNRKSSRGRGGSRARGASSTTRRNTTGGTSSQRGGRTAVRARGSSSNGRTGATASRSTQARLSSSNSLLRMMPM